MSRHGPATEDRAQSVEAAALRWRRQRLSLASELAALHSSLQRRVADGLPISHACLAQALPGRCCEMLLALLEQEPSSHLLSAPALHRGRGYKNSPALLRSNQQRAVRGLESLGQPTSGKSSSTFVSEMWWRICSEASNVL